MDGTRHRGETLVLNATSLTPEGSAWLIVEGQGWNGGGRPVEIGRDPIVLGSAEGCGLRIDDPHVSRRHAEILRTPSGIVLRDLGSRNGTLVGRIAVKEVVLTSGAEIKLGNTTLHFEMGGEAGRLGHLAHDPVRDEELAGVPTRFGPAIGTSPGMRRVFALLGRLAPTELTITFIGETGTGKDVLAHAVHQASPRAGGPFVVFDCGGVSAQLVASELFGHERGAFTGAIAQKVGRFELADGGTLFLDEVGDIPLELQPKLLRVLQEHEFERLGSTRTKRTDVRIVAATHRSLEEMVAAGTFRSDLYYRFNVFPIVLPSLRERRDDIPRLVRYFVQKFARAMNKQIETIPSEAMSVLAAYDWPGNVRELENAIERAVILTNGSALQVPLAEFQRRTSAPPPMDGTLEATERQAILAALREANWVIAGPRGAARHLGLKRSTLVSRMQKLGIVRPGS